MIARSNILSWTMLAVLPLMAACGKSDDARTDSAMAANAMRGDSGVMGGMNGIMPRRGTDSMSAMPSGSSMPGMSAAMVAHMSAMKGASNSAMKSMLPAHTTMVDGMLSQMSEQTRRMKMAATPAWSALRDSIRTDLQQMSGMSATSLSAMMPAHEMRITHLAAIYEEAMKHER